MCVRLGVRTHAEHSSYAQGWVCGGGPDAVPCPDVERSIVTGIGSLISPIAAVPVNCVDSLSI
jgi:hypothetical protein